MAADEIDLSGDRRVMLISGDEYPAVFAALAEQSRHSILGAYYLLSVFPDGDHHRSQRRTMQSLARAQARGVPVKLVIGWPSLDSSKRRNVVATRFLSRRNISVRVAAGLPFHYKFCVFDEVYGLIGSHNLTTGALVHNLEMSVALQDAEACKELVVLHRRLWDASQVI